MNICKHKNFLLSHRGQGWGLNHIFIPSPIANVSSIHNIAGQQQESCSSKKFTYSHFWFELFFSSCFAFSTVILIRDWIWFIIWNIFPGVPVPASFSCCFPSSMSSVSDPMSASGSPMSLSLARPGSEEAEPSWRSDCACAERFRTDPFLGRSVSLSHSFSRSSPCSSSWDLWSLK